MAALSGEPKSKEKAGFSRGREGPWAWPLPCACLFASTPSLAPAQSRWPARRRRRLRGVLSSSDAHPLDLPGPLLEAQSLLNRTHEHARARGLLIQVPRAAGVRVLRCGSVRRAVRGRSQGPGRVGRGPPVCRTSLSRPLLAWQRAPTTCCYGGNNSSSVCGVMRDFHFLCCVGLQYSDFYNEVVLLLLLQKKKKTPFPSAPAAVPWSSSVGSPTRWRTGAGVSCRRSRRCCKTPNSISPLF